MSLDNITKEQFQLYRQVQEKEKKLHQIETENYSNYRGTDLGGFGALAGGGAATFLGVIGISMPLAAVFGVLGIASGVVTYSLIRDIIKNKKTIGNLEKELEQLKSKPEYKALE